MSIQAIVIFVELMHKRADRHDKIAISYQKTNTTLAISHKAKAEECRDIAKLYQKHSEEIEPKAHKELF